MWVSIVAGPVMRLAGSRARPARQGGFDMAPTVPDGYSNPRLSKEGGMMPHFPRLTGHRYHGDLMSIHQQSALTREHIENKGSEVRFFRYQT